MTAQTVDVLAELEQRAGASDQDREAWLAERLTGVTATEARTLALVADRKLPPGKREDLILEKVGESNPFKGNAFTAWGNEREKHIADQVQGVHGIRPESRVFRAADNPRFLASPDGVGVTWDDELVVGEYKTSGSDKRVGSAGFADAGYGYQMQWALRVTGARRCLYAHEFRLGDVRSGFVPGDLSMEWVEYDEMIVRRLEALAVDFLDEVDERRRQFADGEGPVIDEHVDSLAVNYLRGLDEGKPWITLKVSMYDELLALFRATGEPFSQRSLLANVSYSPEVHETVLVPDEEAARADDPEDIAGDIAHVEAELGAVRERWAAHCAKFTREETRVKKKEVLRVTAARDTKKEKVS